MEQLFEALPFLAAPFAACLVIASLHCYMGLHVIKRGVIFVDLALAQAAALGAAVALLITPWVCPMPHPQMYLRSSVSAKSPSPRFICINNITIRLGITHTI